MNSNFEFHSYLPMCVQCKYIRFRGGKTHFYIWAKDITIPYIEPPECLFTIENTFDANMYSKLSQSFRILKNQKKGAKGVKDVSNPPIYAPGSEAPYVHALCWVLHPNQKMQNADFTKLPKDMHCRLDMQYRYQDTYVIGICLEGKKNRLVAPYRSLEIKLLMTFV